MHGETLLRDLVILVAVAIPVVLVARRLRVPSVAGFMLTGVAIGPHALGLIGDPGAVQRLADIGVVLLLFAIGLELSISRVVRLGRAVLQGGALQVAGTVAAVAVLGAAAGIPGPPAVFAGLLVAASSTAIVLKILTAREELDAPYGRVVVAISVFQDFAVVPMMLAIPMLAGTAGSVGAAARQVVVSLLVVGGLVVIGRVVIPRLFEIIVREPGREIFTLAIVIVALGAAYVGSLFGISLALGAFLAGLVVSESEYGLQALSDVLPFRDVFTGLFFASVGMLLDLGAVAAAPGLTLGTAVGVVVLKAVVAALAIASLGAGLQASILGGLALAQIGEFSFVLAGAGAPLGLLSPHAYQLFLAATVLSMLLAPFLIARAPAVADAVARWTGHVPLSLPTAEQASVSALRDHVIIVGYGLNGRNLARALRSAGIGYVVLEQNAQTVRRAQAEGEPIYFGDGVSAEVLERIGILRARVVVFAIAAVNDERRGTAVARRLNPQIHIVARTRYVREIEELQRLGADEVVPEEFETSLEIFARVLRRYGVPSSTIRSEVETVRRDHYEVFRGRERPYAGHLTDLSLSLGVRIQVETVEVAAGAVAIGGNARTLQLRTRTGVNVVAVIRGREVIYEPSATFGFAEHDTVVIVGPPEALAKALVLFQAPDHAVPPPAG
jgi:CPA2 family monovalent cation:H+ antiporter-2